MHNNVFMSQSIISAKFVTSNAIFVHHLEVYHYLNHLTTVLLSCEKQGKRDEEEARVCPTSFLDISVGGGTPQKCIEHVNIAANH